MILSDFLSGQKHNDSNPHEIISHSICMLYHKKNIIGNSVKYLVQT